MGNCQAVDTATLVVQHPSGKVERFYWPLSASEVMRNNPGHHVALLLTLLPTTTASSDYNSKQREEDREKDKQLEPHNNNNNNNDSEVRITHVKVLRPTDTLLLGQAYRLITSQEVMKGLWARKYAKMKKKKKKKKDHDDTHC